MLHWSRETSDLKSSFSTCAVFEVRLYLLRIFWCLLSMCGQIIEGIRGS